MKCARCNRAITDAVYKTPAVTRNGKTYCPRCVTMCVECRKKLVPGIDAIKEFNGRPYCTACYRAMDWLTCAGCRVKIIGDYSMILRRLFCPSCAGSARCPLCGCPIGKNIARDARGRVICFFCSRPPRADVAIAAAADEVRAAVSRMCGLELPAAPIVALPYDELQKRSPWNTLQAAGLYAPAEDAVLIVPYYPPEYLKAVLCHELVHAWQFRNWREDYDMRTREGMAMYVEYRYANSMGFREEVAAIESMLKEKTASNYSIGLKMFLDMAREKGEEAVLAYFRSL